MKSFNSFVSVISEAEEKQKQKQKINISKEILPMKPESKPEEPKKTPVQKSVSKKKAEAIKKGYVSPEGRVQEKGVIVNRIRSGALGYGDKGKDPTKYGINPGDVAREKSTLFKRAVSPSKPERTAARKEIKTAISSIEKRYPGSTQRTGTSFRGFSRSVGYTPSKQDISILQRMARPETTGSSAASLSRQLGQGSLNRAQAAADAARDIVAEPKKQENQAVKRTINRTKAFSDLQKAIDKSDIKLPKPGITKSQVQPKPSKTPTEVIAQTKATERQTSLDLGSTRTTAKPTPPSGSALSVTEPKAATKPAKVKSPTPVRPKIQPKPSTSLKSTVASQSRGLKNIARVSSGIAAYMDFKKGRGDVLAKGGGNKRADAAGVFRAAGGFLGGAAGFAAGTPLGPVGQTVGGTTGYMKGAEMGTKLFDRLTGKAGDKVTSKSVLKNIKSTYRDVVPQSVRQNVPSVAKKGFTDFYNQAVPFVKKGYKAYRRFTKIQDLTGGDK